MNDNPPSFIVRKNSISFVVRNITYFQTHLASRGGCFGWIDRVKPGTL